MSKEERKANKGSESNVVRGIEKVFSERGKAEKKRGGPGRRREKEEKEWKEGMEGQGRGKRDKVGCWGR